MASYEFTYQSKLESETKMLEDVMLILEQHDVRGKVRQRFLVSISEAFNNAMIHGNKLKPEKKIMMCISVNKTEICADIIDQGKGGLEKVQNKKPSTLLAEGGRGIDIIRHYASYVDFEEYEKGGLRVRIKFFKDENQQVLNT